jgi:hypothetical protein
MYLLSIIFATARRFIAIDGYDRALALAAKEFVAVVPLLLVVAAWASLDVRQGAGARSSTASDSTAPPRPPSGGSWRGRRAQVNPWRSSGSPRSEWPALRSVLRRWRRARWVRRAVPRARSGRGTSPAWRAPAVEAPEEAGWATTSVRSM